MPATQRVAFATEDCASCSGQGRAPEPSGPLCGLPRQRKTLGCSTVHLLFTLRRQWQARTQQPVVYRPVCGLLGYGLGQDRFHY